MLEGCHHDIHSILHETLKDMEHDRLLELEQRQQGIWSAHSATSLPQEVAHPLMDMIHDCYERNHRKQPLEQWEDALLTGFMLTYLTSQGLGDTDTLKALADSQSTTDEHWLNVKRVLTNTRDEEAAQSAFSDPDTVLHPGHFTVTRASTPHCGPGGQTGRTVLYFRFQCSDRPLPRGLGHDTTETRYDITEMAATALSASMRSGGQ